MWRENVSMLYLSNKFARGFRKQKLKNFKIFQRLHDGPLGTRRVMRQ